MKKFVIASAAVIGAILSSSDVSAYTRYGDYDIQGSILYCYFSQNICFYDNDMNNTKFIPGNIYTIPGKGKYRIWSDTAEEDEHVEGPFDVEYFGPEDEG